jgi:NAD(P)-dependent dehydrogenase (short-subunit alcohol dehydrogenase family)
MTVEESALGPADDILVNVVGSPGGRRGEEVMVEEYESLARVHLCGTRLTARHSVRVMAPSGGAIVNFSSAASFHTDEPIPTIISGAKAGSQGLSASGRPGFVRDRVFAPVDDGWTIEPA